MGNIRNTILSFLDPFYPLFKRFMSKQTFYYAACGGSNTLLDIFLFFVSYNFILNKAAVTLGFLTISPHVAAFLISFFVTFPIGFFLARYIVFPESNLKGRIQLFRYFVLVGVCMFLNYFFIKLFVEGFHLYPTVSKILTTGIVVLFSFVTQKHFTFKTKPAPVKL